MSYVRATRRRGGWILLTAVLLAAAAFGFSALQPKQYEATAALLFMPGQSEPLAGGSGGAVRDAYRDAATNLQLVLLPEIARLTAERMDTTSQNVTSHLRMVAKGQSDVVEVTALGTSAAAAVRLANTYASTFLAFRTDADRANILKAKQAVDGSLAAMTAQDRAGAEGRELAQRSRDLGVQADSQTGNAVLVQQARTPTGPASPKPLRNGAIGAVLGLLLGVVVAMLRERFDRRLGDDEEIEDAADIPLLGSVAHTRAIARTGRATGGELEPFRVLHANLRYGDATRLVRSTLVTSAATGDGKSVVAANLAAAAASVGSRVLLIEADFHRPVLAQRFGLDSAIGLGAVIDGDSLLPEAAQRVAVDGEAHMDVLIAGAPPRSPADLLGSSRMALFVREASAGYDLVVIDTPPVSLVADAIPLVRVVDAVLVVARPGSTPSRAMRRLRDQLAKLQPAMLALVIDGADRPDGYAVYHQAGRQAAEVSDGRRTGSAATGRY